MRLSTDSIGRHRMCELCELKQIDKLYYEDDLIRVLDCDFCRIPMAVLKRHTTDPTTFEAAWLESHLRKAGEQVFGKGKFRIDRKMNKIPDHTHYHARPI